jgi:hypothetical protein
MAKKRLRRAARVSSDKPERATHGTGQQTLMIFLLGMMRINGEVTP